MTERWSGVLTTALAAGLVVLVVDWLARASGIYNDVTRACAIGLGIGAARLLDGRRRR